MVEHQHRQHPGRTVEHLRLRLLGKMAERLRHPEVRPLGDNVLIYLDFRKGSHLKITGTDGTETEIPQPKGRIGA